MPESLSSGALLQDLPEHLRERTRALGAAELRAVGAFVIYWMRTACRGHENPALDTALEAARRLKVPMLVYHALSERYPYASDRHHTFILEGARDVQREMAARGIGYAFHLERPGQRGPHLLKLARHAALLVTEEMPVAPLRGWTGRLAAAAGAPVWCVDTACIVPMGLTDRPFERAFEFRRATMAQRAARIGQVWHDAAPAGPPFLPDDLPFAPVDLASAAIPELVAACAIDHGVGPVPHTPGGSVAGYARWSEFRDRRLANYARARNDPLRPEAVSRMSPYLHYGQVSPFRLAREARAHGREGAAKFLDELLVWRELAYAWCFHRANHATLGALPHWAQQTLDEQRSAPRPALQSWETLARGRTGDPLWDAAQRSLLIHGELHNNVRMTWGKALLEWTEGPERCLETLIDLNHRYALDGRDPNSYGGLLWCLGLFDRPFSPPRAVIGSVRPRPVAAHARRLDVMRYAAAAGRPARADPPRVAVIGAGIAGLSCARTLADHAYDVAVFDKGRSPGGRMATRRADGFEFDHGAQYFTARDACFRRHVESWRQDGLAGPWPDHGVGASGDQRFVGTPAMNAIAKHLAAELGVACGVRVGAVERHAAGWQLADADGTELGTWDAVVVATPAPQAVPLLAAAPALAERAAQAAIDPCWAVLVGLAAPADADFTIARPENGPLAWIARNSSKPGRSGGEAWVLHARHDWSAAHLEDAPEEVARRLLGTFARLLERSTLPVAHLSAHRWRYALASQPIGEPCLFDGALGIGACGDWCLAGRVEAAFLSGRALAGRLLGAAGLVGQDGQRPA
jgi:photolyase PhrII